MSANAQTIWQVKILKQNLLNFSFVKSLCHTYDVMAITYSCFEMYVLKVICSEFGSLFLVCADKIFLTWNYSNVY